MGTCHNDFGCSLAPLLTKLGSWNRIVRGAGERVEGGGWRGEGIYETWIKSGVLSLCSIQFLLVFLFLLQQRYSPDTPVFAISFGRLLRLDIFDDGELWAAGVGTHVLIAVWTLVHKRFDRRFQSIAHQRACFMSDIIYRFCSDFVFSDVL